MCAAAPGPVTISVLQTPILVNISWSPPEFHTEVFQYNVIVTRVTESGPQELCPEVVDIRPTVNTLDTSMSFTDLIEFSNYTITISATFYAFTYNVDEVISDMIFTTLSAGEYISQQDNPE